MTFVVRAGGAGGADVQLRAHKAIMTARVERFRRMFSTSRIATSGQDIIETDDAATHVVVLCRGQFYYFDALWPTGEVAISEKELSNNFTAILSAPQLPTAAIELYRSPINKPPDSNNT